MRIALVYDALVPWVNGGGERRYHELAQHLSGEHEVTHISWTWWDGPSRMELDGVSYVGVGRPPSLYGSDGKRTVREAAAFAARVVPALLRRSWDVVDCSATPYLPLYAAWAATRFTGTPLVATWHEFWGSHWGEYLPDRPVISGVARALEAGARPLADAVVAVSPFTLRRMGMEESDRNRVVPNGVRSSADSTLTAATHAERSVDVVYIGRLIDEKRVDVLIDAIAELGDTRRPVSAVIAGEGPARPHLEERARSRGVQERVEFRGRISDEERSALLGDARVYVLPSLREGFGIGVLEAFAAGAVPIVVEGAHTAAPLLVRDGVDGLVTSANAPSLAQAIRTLCDEAGLLDAMRRSGAGIAIRHDWARIADEMAHVYASLAVTHVPQRRPA